MREKRSINIELLRIICMLMIVSLHTLNHGGLVEGSLIPNTLNYYLCNILMALCLPAVNCFVMISGYFQCTSSFKLRKLITIWGLALFYSVIIYLVIAILNHTFIDNTFIFFVDFFKSLMVFSLKRYWFVTAYLLMYVLSPFLNIAIHAMGKKQHFICCCVLLSLFSVLSNIVFFSDFSGVYGGYSFLWFCVLYVLAAYFRLYIPKCSRCKKKTLLAYLIATLCICGERFMAHAITPYLFGEVKLESLFYSYNSILNVIATVCLFQFFRSIVIKNEFVSEKITRFSSLTFSVYLIHDHPTLRPVLWACLHPSKYFDSPWLMLYILLCVISIFSICSVIDLMRKLVCDRLSILHKVIALCDSIQNRVEIM